jgi:hypothetical protein
MVAFEFQILLLPFYRTTLLRSVRDCSRHSVEVKTDTEQHKAKNNSKEYLIVVGGETLNEGGESVQADGMGELLSCLAVSLGSFLVLRVILVGHGFA